MSEQLCDNDEGITFGQCEAGDDCEQIKRWKVTDSTPLSALPLADYLGEDGLCGVCSGDRED